MRFIVMATVVSTVAVLARRHPVALVAAGLLLQLLVPSVLIGAQFTGPAAVSAHPGSLLVLVTFVVHVLTRGEELLRAWLRSAELVAVLLAVVAMLLLQSLLGGGGGAPSFVLDQVAAPLAAFLLLCPALTGDPRVAERLRALILVVGAAEALLATAQLAAGSIILFESAFETQDWYTGDVQRWMGTTDHPLVLSVLLVGCIPLLAGVRRWYVSMPLLALYVNGILITQSRVGIASAGIATAYVLLRGRASGGVRIGMTALAAVLGVAALLAGLFDGVLHRFTDRSDLSTAARGLAADHFWQIVPDYLWTGGGVGASYAIATKARLLSSFENSFFMFTLDFGAVATLCYFGAMTAALALGLWRHAPRGFVVAGGLVVLDIVSFSALGVRTSIPMFLWILLAVAAFAGTGRVAAHPHVRRWEARPHHETPAPVAAGGAW